MAESAVSGEEPKEEVEDERTKFLRINKNILKWKAPANEFEPVEHFDTAKAWDALLSLPSCQEIMIPESNQRRLHMVVGENVTQEFPWKEIQYRNLRDNLFDDLPNGQMYYNAFQGYDIDSHVLLGYVPLLTQDMDDPPPGDPFVMYIDPTDAKLALVIIRNLENYERLMISRRLQRLPRAWVSLGSENEVNLTISQRYHEPVDVEIQSVYPLNIPAEKKFSFRMSRDVRDGYVELIPSDSARFDNVARRRITVGIQSAMPRIDIEQQTDPTFPTNAWAQYLYEINEDEDCLDPLTEDEDDKSKPASRAVTPEPPKPPKPPPDVSDRIHFLLKTLEFNQIDMYRNDYPLISNSCIMHHTTPSLEETLCFANISKSQQRYVCGYDWYPTIAGLIVTSYTFSTAATVDSVNTKIDQIQRMVLQPNPILLWSFDDNLNYKLEFESPLEITSLSFCPYDSNILIGGASNGQVILWDLQNRAERLDYTEMLSSAQVRYRVLMNEFLKWTIQINEDMIIFPATVSRLDKSQKAHITAIQWLDKRCSVNTFGKLSLEKSSKANHRYFLTCSLDGSVGFWDLDSQVGKKASSSMRRDLPKALAQSESSYKGKVLVPVFMVAFSEPLTAFVADTPSFKCYRKDASKGDNNLYNYQVELSTTEPAEVRQSFIVSSFYGRIERISWLGMYADTEGKEVVSISEHFARIHDGPVISMKKNPFLPWLFVSIGRNVFAVWKEDYNYSPIFWRRCQNDLTAVAWSESRPSVLFLTRIDGSLEAWDILARDDDACLNDVLGGGIVTQICEHKLTEPDKLLGIGDYNSSLRMVKLPKSFYWLSSQEIEDMKNYILNEESRKKAIQAWEQQYYERNKEAIEAKRQAERDAHKEMERQEKEKVLQAVRKAKEEEEAKRNAAPPAHLTYTERMKRQWYELNLNRLLNILMTRKRVNEKQLRQETVLEKERLAYEAAKKESLADVLARIGDEIAAVRLRIFPQEIPDLQRSDMIQTSVETVLQQVETYEDIESEINSIMENVEEFQQMDYADFLHRGEERRRNISKSLGGNTQRFYWYDLMRAERQLSECNWGFEMYADLLQIMDIGSRPPSDISLMMTKPVSAEEIEDEADVEEED
ncbi:missing minor mitochondria isoform X2 [Musca autumnalis]|uniref:missing minor mitochondria isoform X2 n=1 Tax=Musca autumnalis TaxID=221902 RepID=UPI003CF7A6A1